MHSPPAPAACLLLLLALSACSGGRVAEQEGTVTAMRADLDAARAEIDRLEAENLSMDRQLREAMDAAARAGGGTDRGETVAVLEARDLFGSGGARLTRAGTDRLADVAARLRTEFPGRLVRIEGHSDSQPIRTARFPSNWDLSTARASAVAVHFQQTHGFDGTMLEAVGLAEHHPVADNGTAEGRRQNRRVRIAVLDG
ncbi:MAG: OmpA family protein [Bacteroidota bacterium]